MVDSLISTEVMKDTHKRIMEERGCDISRIIEFRWDMHRNAELGFQEFETQRKIREAILSFGLSESCIKMCASTGLIVDIEGTLKTGSQLHRKIAFRADIDALPIPEDNPDLEYKSITSAAHMCGHDGHTSTLLAAAQVLIKNIDKIPCGTSIRLLFQPAEEGPGGALPMIKEGCLDGVDEVYGYHNIPNFKEGDVRVVSGPILASGTTCKIKVHGQGGHGSAPHLIQDVITAGSAIYSNLHTIKSRGIDSKQNFTFTITQFTSGHTYNVFPDEAFMQGTIRGYCEKTKELVKEKVKTIAQNTALAHSCKADVNLEDAYPAVINHETETSHVIRVASKWFGVERVSSNELPLTACEDFSFYLNEKPGCFYMLGTQQEGTNYTLHTSHYDYNDSMIASGALLFIGIVEDRLGAQIL